MLIIRRIRPCPNACGVLPSVELRRELSHDAAPQDHSQPQPTRPGRNPHVAEHGLIFLMMGITMPETC